MACMRSGGQAGCRVIGAACPGCQHTHTDTASAPAANAHMPLHAHGQSHRAHRYASTDWQARSPTSAPPHTGPWLAQHHERFSRKLPKAPPAATHTPAIPLEAQWWRAHSRALHRHARAHHDLLGHSVVAHAAHEQRGLGNVLSRYRGHSCAAVHSCARGQGSDKQKRTHAHTQACPHLGLDEHAALALVPARHSGVNQACVQWAAPLSNDNVTLHPRCPFNRLGGTHLG